MSKETVTEVFEREEVFENHVSLKRSTSRTCEELLQLNHYNNNNNNNWKTISGLSGGHEEHKNGAAETACIPDTQNQEMNNKIRILSWEVPGLLAMLQQSVETMVIRGGRIQLLSLVLGPLTSQCEMRGLYR